MAARSAEDGTKDVTWVAPDGQEFELSDWTDTSMRALGMVLNGAAGEYRTPGGQLDSGESFFVLLNAAANTVDFHVPELPSPFVWDCLIDTTEADGQPEPGSFDLLRSGDVVRLSGRSVLLFITVARAVRSGRRGPPARRHRPLQEPFPFSSPTNRRARDPTTPLLPTPIPAAKLI